MGRKRKSSAAAAVERPIFCFYCDRIFADETTLIVHQKGKHFKCTECSKRLNSVGGCAIHLLQVHRVEIKSVPNSKEGRGGLEWEIFGMAGVPDGMMPGGPVPEGEDSASKSQRADDTPGQVPAGQYNHGRQQYPPGSAPYSSAMPYPMMSPPPHGFPPMPIGSYGMMPPPGLSAPPYGFRPTMMPPPGHQMPLLRPPPHSDSGPVATSMPTASGPNGGLPPGLQLHSSGPLFPIEQPSPVLPAVSAAASQPKASTPEPVSAGTPGPEPAVLWTDESYSMEERRAQAASNRSDSTALGATSQAAAPTSHLPLYQPLQQLSQQPGVSRY